MEPNKNEQETAHGVYRNCTGLEKSIAQREQNKEDMDVGSSMGGVIQDLWRGWEGTCSGDKCRTRVHLGGNERQIKGKIEQSRKGAKIKLRGWSKVSCL